MPKSKGHKYWNKFTGWASREGQVRAEMPEALQEFLLDPSRIPENSQSQVQQLFEGWFLLDRKLLRANATPLEFFIRSHERRLKPAELDVYKRFAENNRFGFFRVEETTPGEGMKLRLMPEGDLFHVVEVEGSGSAQKDSYLITRIVPFEDHWLLEGLVAAFPSDSSYILDRTFGESSRKLKAGELRPRHVLSLFIPKINWERESLPRVKARLSMILQRWGVSDITASMVDKDIAAAHARRDMSHPLFKTILERAPSPEEAREAVALLTAWWNLTLPPGATPEVPRGPKETMLLHDLQRVVGARIEADALDATTKASELARTLTKEWLDAPQKELGGKTPMQVIGDERKALGNPREELGISLFPAAFELGPEASEAITLANQGTDYLIKKDAARALDCLQKAYARMKDHPDAFRVLGKLATACVMLGRREQAMEFLRASLKANPDYESARDNLRLLETMSYEEFARNHRVGFFEKTNEITGP